jgi:hypothetical protein
MARRYRNWLAEIRGLTAFFGLGREESKRFTQTDIVTSDFFHQLGEWVPHRIPSITQEAERRQLLPESLSSPHARGDKELAQSSDFSALLDQTTGSGARMIGAQSLSS